MKANLRTRLRPSLVLFLALLLLALPIAAGAQVIPLATVGNPNTDSFPNITTFIDVRNGQGDFVSGLLPQNLMIVENEEKIPVDSIREVEQGVQFVLAMNPGTTFAIRDGAGNTRYSYLVSALESWALSQPSRTIDDFSLLTTTDVQQHVSLDAWLERLRSAPDDYRNAFQNLQILSRAIDAATDDAPRDGMGRAILLITPNAEQDMIPAIRNFEARARTAGVRVFVWVVASPSFFTTQGTTALNELAVNTGGKFFGFSGEEQIPNIEEYLSPLRSAYEVTYRSQILTTGAHSLAVEVVTDDFTTRSLPQTFDLEVLPPNPILVSPPTLLSRSLVDDASSENPVYTPNAQTIDILIEFPDGIERELVRTTLYVDGQIAVENTEPPFDSFQWSLESYLETGRHNIRIEAVDEFGLSSLSLETPIDISVEAPLEGIAATVSANTPLLAIIMVAMAGAIVLLILVLTGRIQPKIQPVRLPIHRRRQKQEDPVYQPVAPTASTNGGPSRRQRLSKWANRIPQKLNWPQRDGQSEPFAYLERLLRPSEMEEITPTRPIPITTTEITIGTDPAQSTLVVEDTSIEPLHARLKKIGTDQFTIRDQETAAGTWINYTPTEIKDTKLRHGDVIHIGRIGFRFKLNRPPKTFTPKIILEEIEL